MNTLAIVSAGLLLVFALFQAVFGIAFARLLDRSRPQEADDAELPHASILLSLRGADPFLAKGLRRLMQQNYPRYDLRIVADHVDDPSWQVVSEAVEATGFQHVEVSPLRERSDRCSLKCAALVQLVRGLDERTEVVVFADADLVSHDDWLRELVAPLLQENVGATHGNRWFWPRQARWGSLVRYLWNVAAVVPMYFYEIPWGGTFAIRVDLLHDADLLEKWSKAVVEDAPVRSALAEHGASIRFVPSLMMVNREDCTLSFSLDFIKRQLTWTRIYHPRWTPVVVHALLTSGLLVCVVVALPLALWQGTLVSAEILAGGLAAYLAVMLVLIGLIESSVRRVVARRGEEVVRFSPTAWLAMAAAIPLTQSIHMLAVLLAIFRRCVRWRGVTYRVRGPWDVQMLDYQPYDQAPQSANSNLSL